MHKSRSDTLEVLACAPPGVARATPLLFLHGAYTAAWCWQEHFLPFFAAAGFSCHALSFSGHGASRQRERLDSYSIEDYVQDIAAVVAELPAPPVLIGHSMGGFVVQKYLEKHAAPAAVLMCSVPPQGLAASALGMLFGGRANLLSDLNSLMSGGSVALESLREALFAQPVAAADLARYHRLAQPESHRAIWDMTLFNLPRAAAVLAHLPKDGLLVQGAAHDMIIAASLVEMTARSYGVAAKIFSGMGHGLMLEADWQRPARHVIEWLNEKGLP